MNHWEASHGKADEVGRKERLLVPVVWTPLGMKEEAQVQPLDQGRSADSAGGPAGPPQMDPGEMLAACRVKACRRRGGGGDFQ